MNELGSALDSANAGNRYLLVQSNTASVANRPDKDSGHWALLGTGDSRPANSTCIDAQSAAIARR